MRTASNERRCRYCKKLLLDEKIPFCRRCKLEGRNIGGKVLGTAAGIYATIKGINSLGNSGEANIGDHSLDI